MKIRIICALGLIIGVALFVRAELLTISVGRVDVQEQLRSNPGDMMGYLTEAGNARVNAYERISILVNERCTENPAECAALGVSVRPR